VDASDDKTHIGSMFGAWGETNILQVYVKDCKSNNVDCAYDSVGAYDVGATYAILTVEKSGATEIYYSGTDSVSTPITAGKSETWAKVNYTSLVSFNAETGTLTFSYTENK